MDTNQIFILGAPRSGTTFLSGLLRFTRYGRPVESHFITKYYRKLEVYGDLSKIENFNNLLKDILSERPVQQWKLKLDIHEFYNEVKPDFTYSNIVNKIMLKRPNLSTRNSWGDKTPHYLNNVDIINTVFPRAKFIYIIRDGRDVALSLLKKSWGPANTIACAEYWSRLNRQSNTIEALEKDGQLLKIYYEELLSNPEIIIDNIYKFLNEECSIEQRNQLSVTAKSNNFNKWRDSMTQGQIRQFEAIAKPTLIRLGYSVVNTYPKLYPFEYSLSKLHSFAHKSIFLFKTNVIDGFKIRFLGKEPFNE